VDAGDGSYARLRRSFTARRDGDLVTTRTITDVIGEASAEAEVWFHPVAGGRTASFQRRPWASPGRARFSRSESTKKPLTLVVLGEVPEPVSETFGASRQRSRTWPARLVPRRTARA